jgi:hypothetical protein
MDADQVTSSQPPRPKDTSGVITPEPAESESVSETPSLQSNTTQQRYQRPALIDLDQIRKCLDECLVNHGTCCNNRYPDLLSSHLKTLTLVNVHTNALVTLPVSTPYVALSYVWGNAEVVKAQASNIEELRRSGAFVEEGIVIPDTIRDAIYLVKTLGKHYLWVDTLSVTQDQDKDSMDSMLRAMAYITPAQSLRSWLPMVRMHITV